MPILYAAIILLLSVNVLLGLPKATTFIQTTVSAQNLRKTPGQVAGVQTSKVFAKSQGLAAPILSSRASLVEDINSGQVLYSKDPEERVPIASTTKIMTALVAKNYFKPDDALTVPDLSGIIGSSMGLKTGEQMTFQNLLYGMLLNSGNDAAYTIASNYPGGVTAFVAAMNNKALEMNLTHTHFDNPIGYDSPDHFSSASDLAKVSILLVNDPTLSQIVDTKQAVVASVDGKIVHNLENLNELLGEDGVVGVKTGTTPLAKENFVGLVDKNNQRILTIVLGSDDRFADTQKLIDWTFNNFTW